MSLARRLGATYRLQLIPGFGFADAARTVPYLSALGIETVYLSPVAEAVPGSMHGYDGTDPTRLREELGGEAAFDLLVAACEAQGMGICVDLVPNHLSTWPGGPWWRRLLAEGPGSAVAAVFDVEWDAGPPGQRGKVALPLLDRPLEQAVADGLVRLGERDGEPVVLAGEADLPVAGGVVRAGDDLADVLGAQRYRLVDWHDAGDRNYRRFFDVDGLVGVRVEIPEVFGATHALVVRLASAGKVSAVRVDHVDGLKEPAAYLRRLADATGLPIVVEKILSGDEELPCGWPVDGTTGYEVIDRIGGLLVDPGGQQRLVAAGRAEGDEDVASLTLESRRLVARTRFPGDVARAAGRLGVGAAELEDTVVRLPRYRTYLDGTATGEREAAVWRSVEDGEAGRRAVVDALLDPARRDATLGVQQLSGGLMAKGVEDTAWYRLSGTLAFCEVGGDPGRDRHGAAAGWHEWCARRSRSAHRGLVPGTTHDTKRAQDVRCRLYALSEMPEWFEAGLRRLRLAFGLPPEGGDLAFETRVVAQTVLGMLPRLEPGGTTGEAGHGHGRPGIGDASWPADERVLTERLGAALRKGAREAKRRSSWLRPDGAYETRLVELGAAALAGGGALTRSCFGPLVDEVARLGAVYSLSSVLLRHSVPGIPDCYQGDEAWNLSLVDPDNRRPVDFGRLEAALTSLGGGGSGTQPRTGTVGEENGGVAELEALRRSWRDGRVKLFVTRRCLTARRSAGGAMDPGADYVPLAVRGPALGSVLAFGRSAGAQWAVAVCTTRARTLAAGAGDLPAGPAYSNTLVQLPRDAPARFTDAVSGATIDATGGVLDVDRVLATLPVALLAAGDPACG